MIIENDVDNSIGLAMEKSTQTIDDSKNSTYYDLGDDQAFPFIPGFGKNSGKDWSILVSKCVEAKNKITIFFNNH